MAQYFLGLDSSTQGLGALIIDLESRRIVYDRALSFGDALPQYETRNGALFNEDASIAHAPPLMWLDALDLLCSEMQKDGAPLAEVVAVSGSGQQHGSVYLTAGAPSLFGNLDVRRSLAENMAPALARQTAPIWMDSSTGRECEEIRSALGGMEATARITGSNACERFAGPQIRKFHKQEPEAYDKTAHIALVSSFMASTLAGRIAPIDWGDGAGMNLMDIDSRQWCPAALDATAPGLLEKLPDLVPSWTVVGPIAAYFVERYGFNSGCLTLAWSGDNPSSVIGLGLVEPGMTAISLGTSDTCFGTIRECRTDPRGEGHVFGSPTGDYMTLICLTNGSLAREKVRAKYNMDWQQFSAALQSTPVGNKGGMMLPYFEAETVPRVRVPGVRRSNLDEDDAAANCRAVVEAQMMSIRLHSEWMGMRPVSIYATGGASVNEAILQVMADVQGCPVQRTETPNSAALGAAIRAAHGYLCHRGGESNWRGLVADFAAPLPGSTVRPDPDAAAIYDEFIKAFGDFEGSVLAGDE